MTLPAAYFDGDGDPTRLDQPSDHHDKHASWQTDASGNVTGLVGPGGAAIALGDTGKPGSDILEIIKTTDTATWAANKTAALSVSVDNSVRYGGRPSLKITIPAGTSGFIQVGINAASVRVPYGWDRNNLAYALRYSGFTKASVEGDLVTTGRWTSVQPPAVNVYIGEASYSKFWVCGKSLLGNEFQPLHPGPEKWITYHISASEQTATGEPTLGSSMAFKFAWTQVAQAQDSYIHIGFFGIKPIRKKATCIFSIDDGFSSCYDFIAPLAKHYDIPVSLAVSSSFPGAANYMTSAKIAELFADRSRLFDIVNHMVDNTGYTTLGAAAAYAQMQTCTTYLRQIGIYGDGPLHVPYVKTERGNNLIELMQAGGYLSGRAGVPTSPPYETHKYDAAITSGDDRLRWHIPVSAWLGTETGGVDAAGFTTLVDAAILDKRLFVLAGHDFAAASGNYVWSYANTEQAFAYLATKVAAGELECKSYTKWYADLTGRPTDRR